MSPRVRDFSLVAAACALLILAAAGVVAGISIVGKSIGFDSTSASGASQPTHTVSISPAPSIPPTPPCPPGVTETVEAAMDRTLNGVGGAICEGDWIVANVGLGNVQSSRVVTVYLHEDKGKWSTVEQSFVCGAGAPDAIVIAAEC